MGRVFGDEGIPSHPLPGEFSISQQQIPLLKSNYCKIDKNDKNSVMPMVQGNSHPPRWWEENLVQPSWPAVW